MANFENFERGYLLPKGCKDLIDAINLHPEPPIKIFGELTPLPLNQQAKGDLWVSEKSTVGELAALLGQKPFKIIADLMQLGVFATVKQAIGFEAISQVAAKYGYSAKRLA